MTHEEVEAVRARTGCDLTKMSGAERVALARHAKTCAVCINRTNAVLSSLSLGEFVAAALVVAPMVAKDELDPENR